jgi:hypothetical protein
MQRNAALRSLRVASNRVRADGAHLIAELLQANGTLSDLDLANNQLSTGEQGGRTCDGVVALCKSVYSNESVTSLNLASNALASENIATAKSAGKSKVGRALSRVVTSNRSLTNLDVQHNGFEKDVGVQALLDSFRRNDTLTMLNDKRLDIVKVQIWDLT